MTPTATELLNDPAFLRKRIKEQREYIKDYEIWYRGLELDFRLFCVPVSAWREERKKEVVESAIVLMNYYNAMLQLLAAHGIFPTEKEE